MSHNKEQIFSGTKAIPDLMIFRLSMLKYFFQRRKYPLFVVSSSGGGIIETSKMLKQLKICKFVKHNGSCYFSLNMPHWPSKPFDNMVANGGLNITAGGTLLKQQIDTAILGITRRCGYQCTHCYEHFNLGEADTVPVLKLVDIVGKLQKRGVSIIVFSGGEPMMRYEGLLKLLKTADHSRSDFHIHTSGCDVTREKAFALKEAGLNAAGVGLDDVDPARNDAFRGHIGAFNQAVAAIRYFQEAGIFTYVNTCLTKDLIRSGDLMDYLQLLKELNVGIVRWLEPKPCGGYLNEKASGLLSEEDRSIVTDLYARSNTEGYFRDYPLIAYEDFVEAPENLGCMMAGNSLMYVDSVGNVEPCVFLPVTFGNIMQEDFNVIMDRMRKTFPKPLHIACPASQLGPVIKRKKEEGSSFPVPWEDLADEISQLSN